MNAVTINRITTTLPGDIASGLGRLLDDWQAGDKTARLWSADATLWSGGDEADWLGWLDVIERSRSRLDTLHEFAREIRDAGITHVVLLGMGGSSMAPEVISETLGVQPGYPDLQVLDSTNPAEILDVDGLIDPERTLFIVSSKSGSSLEPNILMDYFFGRVSAVTGADSAGRHFIAITDPGTSLEKLAGERNFRHVFHGEPSIGGRFSALSNFGLVPAALIGVDCARLLEAARVMAEACSPGAAIDDNPGVQLGCYMGAGVQNGRDKLTLVLPAGLASLGAWLEQLVAESSGKSGKGIIPVDGEQAGVPADYGDDRLFVCMHLEDAPDQQQQREIDALAAAGQPVIQVGFRDVYDLGGAFFYWQIATAVVGSIIGVNPFDQPDVEASKVEARRITAACESGSPLSDDTALADDGVISVYTDAANTAVLKAACGEDVSVAGLIRAHLARLGAGDYFGLLAYLHRNETNTGRLNAIRHRVRQSHGVATCLGFGPRFLHSTGQAYKGGANNGVFLQLTASPVKDLYSPGRACSFGVITTAQAHGDFEVMATRGRRILRIHLGAGADAGLERLEEIFTDIYQ